MITPRLVIGLSRNLLALEGPPRLFARHPGTVVGNDEEVEIDPRLGTFIAEGEIGIVIGTRTRDVGAAEAASSIAGWVIGNDITALDLVAEDGYSQEAKGWATPLSAIVEPDFDADDAVIEVRVNGDLRATGRMSLLGIRGPELVSWVSKTQTLLEGDIVLCGAPGTATPVHPGDVVHIVVPGLGSLANTIVSASSETRP